MDCDNKCSFEIHKSSIFERDFTETNRQKLKCSTANSILSFSIRFRLKNNRLSLKHLKNKKKIKKSREFVRDRPRGKRTRRRRGETGVGSRTRGRVVYINIIISVACETFMVSDVYGQARRPVSRGEL